MLMSVLDRRCSQGDELTNFSAELKITAQLDCLVSSLSTPSAPVGCHTLD
jgi:hypothetical protein